MKTVPNTLLAFLAITFFFASCSNYYYSPNDGDMVTLRKQHDGHISGSSNLGDGESKKVMNIQAGYSPINHLAFAGSYFKTSEGDNNGRFGEGNILSGAIGGYYFMPVEDNSIFNTRRRKERSPNHPNLNLEKGILLDFYVGTGEGKVNNLYTQGGRSQFGFRKDYVQMGFHLIKKNWGLSYNVRRGWLNYSNGKIYNQLKIDNSDLEKFQELTVNNSFGLMEQSFRLHIGVSHFRYFFNITSVRETAELRNLGVENNNFTVGFILEIDEFFRKKIKREEEVEVDF